MKEQDKKFTSAGDAANAEANAAANADANAKVRMSGASDEHPDIEMAARPKIAMPPMPDNTAVSATDSVGGSAGAYYNASDADSDAPDVPDYSDPSVGGGHNSSVALKHFSNQMRAKDIWLGILAALLAASLAASFYLGSAFFAAKRDMERRTDATGYQIALENQYQEHLYELCEQLSSIENDLLKATVSNSAAMQQHQLSLVEGYTTSSFSGLSALPHDGESRAMDKCIHFANQCNDYCRFLSDELSAAGGVRTLDTGEKANLRALARVAGRLSKKLGKIAESGQEFTYDFDGDIPQAVKSMSAIPERSFKHPDIVYDGTYTDAPIKKSIKKVGKKLSNEECKERLLVVLSAEGAKTVEKVGEIKSDYKAKVYDILTAKGKYNVIMCEDGRIVELSFVGSGSVVLGEGAADSGEGGGQMKAEQNPETKTEKQKSGDADGGNDSTNGVGVVPRTAESRAQNNAANGGKSAKGTNGADKISDEEYKSAAVSAAKRAGYGELTAVELKKPQMGRIFVTLVPTMAGDILVYPRKVVVCLAESDAQTLGISAQGYLFEEKEREMPKSVQSAEAAQEKLWDKLKVENVRRAVISTGAREYFCYEFECISAGKTVFVYIDMQTLAEREIKITDTA